MKFCGKCGTQLEDSVMFCHTCGHSQVAQNDYYKQLSNSDLKSIQQDTQSGINYNQFQNSNQTDNNTQPKKSKKGLIICLSIIGAILIAAIILAIALLGKSSKDNADTSTLEGFGKAYAQYYNDRSFSHYKKLEYPGTYDEDEVKKTLNSINKYLKDNNMSMNCKFIKIRKIDDYSDEDIHELKNYYSQVYGLDLDFEEIIQVEITIEMTYVTNGKKEVEEKTPTEVIFKIDGKWYAEDSLTAF